MLQSTGMHQYLNIPIQNFAVQKLYEEFDFFVAEPKMSIQTW